MKMRKTIYPVALVIAVPLVFLVFFILNQGRFENINDTAFSSSMLEQNDALFYQYHVKWRGFGKPNIESITFTDNADVNMTAFIKEYNEVEGMLQKVDLELYKDANNTEITHPEFSLLLKMNPNDKKAMEKVRSITLRYKTFGIVREQTIELADENYP